MNVVRNKSNFYYYSLLINRKGNEMKNVPKYMIYDGRYRFDEDRAIVMDMADTLSEANAAAKDQGDAVVVDSKTGAIVYG